MNPDDQAPTGLGSDPEPIEPGASREPRPVEAPSRSLKKNRGDLVVLLGIGLPVLLSSLGYSGLDYGEFGLEADQGRRDVFRRNRRGPCRSCAGHCRNTFFRGAARSLDVRGVPFTSVVQRHERSAASKVRAFQERRRAGPETASVDQRAAFVRRRVDRGSGHQDQNNQKRFSAITNIIRTA